MAARNHTVKELSVARVKDRIRVAMMRAQPKAADLDGNWAVLERLARQPCPLPTVGT